MHSARSAHFRLLQWLLVLLLIAGCAGRSTPPSIPTLETPQAFTESGQITAPNRWWTAFGVAQLDQQVDRALTDNYTLTAAGFQVRAARALTRREASDFWPDIDGILGISTTGGPGENFQTYEVGLNGNYQVDLWGEIESRVDAQRYRAAATCWDYHAVALALSAEITSTWFALIEANAEAELLEEQIETNRTGLKLQEQRFGLGLIRSADVLRQRQLLESTLEQTAINATSIEVLEHQLATLLGEMPQGASYQTGTTFPELPPLPTTGLSSDLILRRPDIQSNFHALVAADRDLASAISAQYPRLNLSSSLRSLTENPESLLRDWVISIGGQLVAPLFDGGQRKADVDITNAIKYQLFNVWAQSVLEAFREVEDSLTQEKYQIQQIEHLEAQVKLAGQASNQLREQYLIGDAEYLDVLSAITGQQSLQRQLLTAQLNLRLIRVSLYLALAGNIDSNSTSNSISEVPWVNLENVVEETESGDTIGVDDPQVPDVPDETDLKKPDLRTIEGPLEPIDIPDREELPLLDRLRETIKDE